MSASLAQTPEASVRANGDLRAGHSVTPGADEEMIPRTHRKYGERLNDRSYYFALLDMMLFFVTLAGVVTVVLYLAGNSVELLKQANTNPGWWTEWKSIIAPVAGIAVGIAAAILAAAKHEKIRDSRAHTVDPSVYGEIRDRIETVNIFIHLLCPENAADSANSPRSVTCKASCRESWSRRETLLAELNRRGSHWLRGSGYVDAWRQVHAIEEALFLVQPIDELVGNATFDELRLNGAAEIPNWQKLTDSLQRAKEALASTIAGPSTDNFATSADATSSSAPQPANETYHRLSLRDVRRAINGFRDGERANLVRARNQLAWTGSLTALAGLALLILAVLARAPETSIIGGVTYFVVGAAVGLFYQLRNNGSSPGQWQEDYGFSRASLVYSPVLSGLAAVGGVMVVTLLNEMVNFGGSATDVNASVRPLQDVFNVETFSFGLLIAAVFGLTPDLLVNRLKQNANDFQNALASSSSSGGSDPNLKVNADNTAAEKKYTASESGPGTTGAK